MTIWRDGLKKMMLEKAAPNKLGIVDGGYQTSEKDEQILSQSKTMDGPEFKRFKSCARLRQETFNGRLKFFAILNNTFQHNPFQHFLAEAVLVTVQYQMDNGAPIFDV